MADGTLAVTAGSGTLLDAESLTVGVNTVLRERTRLAGLASTEVAAIRLGDATAGDGGLIVIPNCKATFRAGSTTVVSSGTSGATTLSLIYLFTNSGVATVMRIRKIGCSWAGGRGGDPVTFSVRRITAENGTPGGTTITPQAMDQADSSAPPTAVRFGANAPTRSGTDYEPKVADLNYPGEAIWDFSRDGVKQPLRRASTSEGYELNVTTGTTGPTTAASFIPWIEWTEGS